MSLREILAQEFQTVGETQYAEAVRNGEDDDIIRASLRAMAKAQEWDGHDSDCAAHNMPEMPNGPCDCSASSSEA